MSLLNLRLMRKGPNYYATSHCMDLVEAAQETFERREGELDRLSEDTDNAPADDSGAVARHE